MHQELGILIPIVAIIAGVWLTINIIRIKHGAGKPQDSDGRLERDNAALRAAVERLEQRIGVLETIAIDPATRTAHEIEQLRNS
jgi:hypothetical protein